MNSILEKEWIKISCRNVQLNEEEKKFILTTLHPIVDLSPTQSSFKLELIGRGEFTEGVLVINSVNQKFVSTVLAANVYRMTTELKKDLLKKIDFWRQSRFLSEAV